MGSVATPTRGPEELSVCVPHWPHRRGSPRPRQRRPPPPPGWPSRPVRSFLIRLSCAARSPWRVIPSAWPTSVRPVGMLYSQRHGLWYLEQHRPRDCLPESRLLEVKFGELKVPPHYWHRLPVREARAIPHGEQYRGTSWGSGKADYFLFERVPSTDGTSLPFRGSPRSVTTSRSPHGFSPRAGTHRGPSGHLRESPHLYPRLAIAGRRPACRDPCSQRRWRQRRRYSPPESCALGRRLARWERLRCWLSVLSPSSPSSSPVTVVNLASSADDSMVDREVSLLTRDRACTVLAAAVTSVVRRIAPAGFISRHHSANLRRSRILRSSSGSRGPGPLGLGSSAPLLMVLSPSPSGPRERRDADHWRGGGGGGGPIIVPVGSPRAFSFVPLADVIPPFVPRFRCEGPWPSSPRAPWSAFPPSPGDGWLPFPKAHPIPQVCAFLFLLTVGRFCALPGRMLHDRPGPRPVASRHVAAVGTAAVGNGGGCHNSGLGVGVVVGVCVGVRSAPRTSLLPFSGSRQPCGVRIPRGCVPPPRTASRVAVETVGGKGGTLCGPCYPPVGPLAERPRSGQRGRTTTAFLVGSNPSAASAPEPRPTPRI